MTKEQREKEKRSKRGKEELEEDGVDYPDTKVQQDEFEELAREEGFDDAVENAARGKKPRKRPSTTSHMP